MHRKKLGVKKMSGLACTKKVTEDEDATELRLGPDFNEAQCLSMAEVRLIQQSKIDDDQETGLETSTTQTRCAHTAESARGGEREGASKIAERCPPFFFSVSPDLLTPFHRRALQRPPALIFSIDRLPTSRAHEALSLVRATLTNQRSPILLSRSLLSLNHLPGKKKRQNMNNTEPLTKPTNTCSASEPSPTRARLRPCASCARKPACRISRRLRWPTCSPKTSTRLRPWCLLWRLGAGRRGGGGGKGEGFLPFLSNAEKVLSQPSCVLVLHLPCLSALKYFSFIYEF